MTDTHSSSLADNLRRLFEQAAVAPNLDSETGIKAWGKILDIDDEVRVMELTLFVLKGLRQLRTALEQDLTIKSDTKSRYQAVISSISNAVTPDIIIKVAWRDIKSRFVSQPNLDTLAFLDDSLTTRASSVEVASADISSMITQFADLRHKLQESNIDALLKKYLIDKISEILYFLNRFDTFGMEGVWEGLSQFHLLFRRFARSFDEAGEHELYDQGTIVAENCIQWLIKLGGIYGGLKALGAATTLLLGSPAY